MRSSQRPWVILLAVLSFLVFPATGLAWYFAWPQVTVFVTEMNIFLPMAGVLFVGSFLALWKPVILRGIILLIGLGVVGTAFYAAFMLTGEFQMLGAMAIVAMFLALIGSALQWHNQKLQDDPNYSTLIAALFVTGLISAGVGDGSSIYWAIGTFILLWLVYILLLLLARKAKARVSKKMRR